jgi:hypothetical protein
MCYCIIGALLVSCASSNQTPVIANSGNIGNISFNNSNTNTEQAAPEKSSARIIRLPADTTETVYFRGISARTPGLQEAVANAEKDAHIRVAGYIAAFVEEKAEDASAYRTSMGQVIENTETALIASSSYISNVVSEVKVFGEPQAARYPDGTVEVQIVAAVERKLLDNAIAGFNRIRDAAKTVQFAGGASAYKGQKGTNIEISAGISADTAVDLGAIDCVFTYTGVKEAQSVTVAGAAHFQVDTARLPAGKYTGVLELQMQKLSPGLENIRKTVVFEITPLNTVRLMLLDAEAAGIAPKVGDILQKQGLLLVETNAAYLATIQVSLNERQTNNYFIVQPTVTITVELERDGKPLVTYTKNYGEFRHVTRAEALQRAYRNIESDLGGNFAEQVRGVGR